jgi:hypothetical protein
MVNVNNSNVTGVSNGSYVNVDDTTGVVTWTDTPQFFTITVGATDNNTYPITLSAGTYILQQLSAGANLTTVANSGQQPGEMAVLADHNAWTAIIKPAANGITAIGTEDIYWYLDKTMVQLQGGWLSSETAGWQPADFIVTAG